MNKKKFIIFKSDQNVIFQIGTSKCPYHNISFEFKKIMRKLGHNYLISTGHKTILKCKTVLKDGY